MRLGIFGGSFDPVHRGHLLLADCCAVQAALDQIWFVPTAQQPLKPDGPTATDAHRLAMLQLACADQPKFEVSSLEIDRGGISYTVDTLKAIRAEQPDAELFFLLGADSLADFPVWHRPTDICRLATLLVVRRAGTQEPDFDVLRPLVSPQHLDQIRNQQIQMPPTPISSSAIRQQIATQGNWQDCVTPEVAHYIRQHALYANPS